MEEGVSGGRLKLTQYGLRRGVACLAVEAVVLGLVSNAWTSFKTVTMKSPKASLYWYNCSVCGSCVTWSASHNLVKAHIRQPASMPVSRLAILRNATTAVSHQRSSSLPRCLLQMSQRKRCMSDKPDSTPPRASEPVRLLSEVDAKGRKLELKPPEKKSKFGGVWFPRTRLFFGVIFIGVLVWDMASVLASILRSSHTNSCSARILLIPSILKSIWKRLRSPSGICWRNESQVCPIPQQCAYVWKRL